MLINIALPLLHAYAGEYGNDELRRFPCNRYRKKWHGSSLTE